MNIWYVKWKQKIIFSSDTQTEMIEGKLQCQREEIMLLALKYCGLPGCVSKEKRESEDAGT